MIINPIQIIGIVGLYLLIAGIIAWGYKRFSHLSTIGEEIIIGCFFPVFLLVGFVILISKLPYLVERILRRNE